MVIIKTRPKGAKLSARVVEEHPQIEPVSSDGAGAATSSLIWRGVTDENTLEMTNNKTFIFFRGWMLKMYVSYILMDIAYIKYRDYILIKM